MCLLSGPLMQPKGQTSVLYTVPDAPTPEQIAAAQARYGITDVGGDEESQQKQQQEQKQ